MRCLWITRVDPTPENSGELIYSAHLIRSFARAGADVTVLCLTHGDATPRGAGCDGDGLRWWRIDRKQRPSWHSLLSPLPHVAHRCAVPAFRRQLVELLRAEEWQLVVFDSLSVGWALPIALSSTTNNGRRPYLVYVSHNHEETTRAQVAANYSGSQIKRAVLRSDARKAALLERRVVAAAHLVTAISPADRALYAAARGGRPLIELSPGYDGRRVEHRRITPDVPRHVVMVGSYDWVAKQSNLREFARIAAPAFREADTALTVVGDGGAILDTLRAEFPSIAFTGRVDSVYPYMDRARMAVVAEKLGGGFKLKTLDYVFNRLPIAALNRTFEGMPLINDESVLSYPDLQELVRGVIGTIDDLTALNRLQDRAYASCVDKFDWSARGRSLLDAVTAL